MSFCFNKDFFCIVLRKQWPFHLSIQLPRYMKSYQKMVKTEIWIVIIIIFKRYSFNKCIWSHYFLTGRTILASSWRTTCCLSCLFSTWTHHKSQGNSGKESQRKEVERGGGVSLEWMLWNSACRVTVDLLVGTSLTQHSQSADAYEKRVKETSIMSPLCYWLWKPQTQTYFTDWLTGVSTKSTWLSLFEFGAGLSRLGLQTSTQKPLPSCR